MIIRWVAACMRKGAESVVSQTNANSHPAWAFEKGRTRRDQHRSFSLFHTTLAVKILCEGAALL